MRYHELQQHTEQRQGVKSANYGASESKPSTSPNHVVRIYVSRDCHKAGSRAHGVQNFGGLAKPIAFSRLKHKGRMTRLPNAHVFTGYAVSI